MKFDREIIGLIIGVSVFVLLIIASFSTWSTQTLTVKSVSWERTINVEYLQTYVEECWGYPPSGGRELSNWLALKSYRVSHTKTDSKGRSHTTHETKWHLKRRCKYEIDRWRHVRTERSHNTDFNPVWPNVVLGNRERSATTSQTYSVKYVGEDQRFYDQTYDESEWRTHKPGYAYRTKLNIFGVILGMEQLQ
ncbi:MAG TPA: hypothetical protein P5056_02560 [Candidatus Paceibacterota bacterium]|nr:hypothetical protein [Candidatus Paceibacterota bacterium]